MFFFLFLFLCLCRANKFVSIRSPNDSENANGVAKDLLKIIIMFDCCDAKEPCCTRTSCNKSKVVPCYLWVFRSHDKTKGYISVLRKRTCFRRVSSSVNAFPSKMCSENLIISVVFVDYQLFNNSETYPRKGFRVRTPTYIIIWQNLK